MHHPPPCTGLELACDAPIILVCIVLYCWIPSCWSGACHTKRNQLSVLIISLVTNRSTSSLQRMENPIYGPFVAWNNPVTLSNFTLRDTACDMFIWYLIWYLFGIRKWKAADDWVSHTYTPFWCLPVIVISHSLVNKGLNDELKTQTTC